MNGLSEACALTFLVPTVKLLKLFSPRSYSKATRLKFKLMKTWWILQVGKEWLVSIIWLKNKALTSLTSKKVFYKLLSPLFWVQAVHLSSELPKTTLMCIMWSAKLVRNGCLLTSMPVLIWLMSMRWNWVNKLQQFSKKMNLFTWKILFVKLRMAACRATSTEKQCLNLVQGVCFRTVVKYSKLARKKQPD